MVDFKCLSSPTDGSVIWTHTVAHGWGCLISWLFTSLTWPEDYSWHGPIDVSHDRWDCLKSGLYTLDVARGLLWARPDRCLPWIRKNLMCDCWGSIYQLRGATGEICNFYNLSARLLIFNTHIPPIINTHTSKFRSCLSDTFWIMIFSFLKKSLFSKFISSHKFKVYDLEIFLQYLRYI